MSEFQNNEPTLTLVYPTTTNPENDEVMVLQVCESPAGFYLGYMSLTGPYERITNYMEEGAAHDWLATIVLSYSRLQQQITNHHILDRELDT
jgi:hypothetical protein